MNGPRVGVTMGDPRGVGPELARVAMARLSGQARMVLYGEARIAEGLEVGCAAFEGPRAARDAIEAAAADLASGALDAVVTGPVSKSCFEGEFPGHTELFAARLGVAEVAMLLVGDRLRVVPATTHVALAEVPGLLDTGRIARLGRLVATELARGFGLPAPRVALAALNPHAGDQGLFGDEEARILGPAVAELRAAGVDATGPWAPDTVYARAARGEFDVVIGPYHDQALIPFKLLHFTDGVNVTLGLPRPRTSPDHGPAYDLAGTGRADPTSMIRAVEMAISLAS